jgi:UTP-glucose-1-phosphate uridylyltransferase
LLLLNKFLLQQSIEEATASDVELIVIVPARGKRGAEDYFDRYVELERMPEQTVETRPLGEVLQPANMADICRISTFNPCLRVRPRALRYRTNVRMAGDLSGVRVG